MNRRGMTLPGRLLLALAALLLVPGAPAAEVEAPVQQLPIVDLGGQRYRVGRIEVDKGAQSFRVSGRFIRHERADPPIEYLAVVPNGEKSYETLLELDASAREFNLACILIGLDAENASLPRFHFDPEPVNGDPVVLTLSWEAGGKTVTRQPGELFSIPDMDPVPEDWVYTGSVLTDRGEYFAESMGLLISFAHEPASIIEHRTGLGIGAYGSLQVNRATMPPPGTPFTLAVSRPAAARPAQLR